MPKTNLCLSDWSKIVGLVVTLVFGLAVPAGMRFASLETTVTLDRERLKMIENGQSVLHRNIAQRDEKILSVLMELRDRIARIEGKFRRDK